MAMSFLCSLGPVWYHPTILSLAGKEKLVALNCYIKIYIFPSKRVRTPVVMFSSFYRNSRHLNLDIPMKSKTQKQDSQKINSRGNLEIYISQTSLDQSYMKQLENNSKAIYKQIQVHVT